MNLSKEHIIEFQTLYEKRFGIALSREKALDKAIRIIRFIEVISKNIADEKSSKTKDIENPQRIP